MMPELIKQLAHSIPSILTGVIIFIGFYILSQVTIGFMHRFAAKSARERQPVFVILTTIARMAILIIGAITALGSAGVNVSALVTSVGLSGLAITLASKDAFSNLLGGVLVLIYQPFKIGDTIEVNNLTGEVIKMSLRYTHLHYQNKEILIPNSSLLTHSVIITMRGK